MAIQFGTFGREQLIFGLVDVWASYTGIVSGLGLRRLCTRLVPHFIPGAAQLCNRWLHYYGFQPSLGKGPHVFEVARGETVLSCEFTLEIDRKPVDH